MEGFQVPIHRSLTQPIMMAGVPREVALMNGTITAALVLGLHAIHALPLAIIFHYLARAAAKEDPEFFKVFRRHMRQKKYYEV